MGARLNEIVSDREPAPTKSRKPPRAWIGNLTLLLAVTILSLGVGEVLVRALVDDMLLFPRYHARADYGEVTLRRLRPDTVFWHSSVDGSWRFETNAQGFRDSEDWSYEKPPGTLRVLVLGDSHTQGMEARQDRTYPEIIERVLTGEAGESQVLNSGVSGFSTAEALAFLEHEGHKYAPDVVVLGLYANDFEDNVKAGLFALEDGRLVARKTSHTPGVAILEAINILPPLRWLSENSYLYSLALNTVWETTKYWVLKRSEAALVTEYAIPSERVDDYKKALLLALVRRLHAFCQDRGIPLIVADIPLFGEPGAGDFTSSIPADLLAPLRSSSEALVLSEDLFADYRGVAEFHVQNGHRHISEFSHLLLGRAVAARIRALP